MAEDTLFREHDDPVEIVLERQYLTYDDKKEISKWCLDNLGYWEFIHFTRPFHAGDFIYTININRSDAPLFILRWC